jgi:hypothetical protein
MSCLRFAIVTSSPSHCKETIPREETVGASAEAGKV